MATMYFQRGPLSRVRGGSPHRPPPSREIIQTITRHVEGPTPMTAYETGTELAFWEGGWAGIRARISRGMRLMEVNEFLHLRIIVNAIVRGIVVEPRILIKDEATGKVSVSLTTMFMIFCNARGRILVGLSRGWRRGRQILACINSS